MAEDCEGQVVPGRLYGRKTPRPLKVEEGHRYKASAAVDKLAEEKLPTVLFRARTDPWDGRGRINT